MSTQRSTGTMAYIRAHLHHQFKDGLVRGHAGYGMMGRQRVGTMMQTFLPDPPVTTHPWPNPVSCPILIEIKSPNLKPPGDPRYASRTDAAWTSGRNMPAVLCARSQPRTTMRRRRLCPVRSRADGYGGTTSSACPTCERFVTGRVPERLYDASQARGVLRPLQPRPQQGAADE